MRKVIERFYPRETPYYRREVSNKSTILWSFIKWLLFVSATLSGSIILIKFIL